MSPWLWSQVNGSIVTTFLELEDAVDSALSSSGDASPAGTVTITVERGGERRTVCPKVRAPHPSPSPPLLLHHVAPWTQSGLRCNVASDHKHALSVAAPLCDPCHLARFCHLRMSAAHKVVDLHALTPTSFLEVGGGTCHNISYTMAMLEGRCLVNCIVAGVLCTTSLLFFAGVLCTTSLLFC